MALPVIGATAAADATFGANDHMLLSYTRVETGLVPTTHACHDSFPAWVPT